MNIVERLDGRLCRVIPMGTSYRDVVDILPYGQSSRQYDGDDAVHGMALYHKGGAVATFCGQFALYEGQREGEPNCIACIARVGLRPKGV